MTTLADKLVEAGARAARNSKAWPEVFSPGSAELLTRAVLLAVLPMVAEDLIAKIQSDLIEIPGEGFPGATVALGVGSATADIRSTISALLADLAREG